MTPNVLCVEACRIAEVGVLDRFDIDFAMSDDPVLIARGSFVSESFNACLTNLFASELNA